MISTKPLSLHLPSPASAAAGGSTTDEAHFRGGHQFTRLKEPTPSSNQRS
jgi:hypothetical protein